MSFKVIHTFFLAILFPGKAWFTCACNSYRRHVCEVDSGSTLFNIGSMQVVDSKIHLSIRTLSGNKKCGISALFVYKTNRVAVISHAYRGMQVVDS